MSHGVHLLIRMVVGLAFVAGLTWIGWKLGGRPWALVALLIAAPAFAWAISRPLIEVIHEGFTWASNQPLAPWEGNYYEFAGVHVRIFEDGGELWFVAADVIKATQIDANANSLLSVYSTGCRVLPGTRLTCLTAAVVEKLMASRSGPHTGGFLLWLRREVVTPWVRKRDGILAAR